MPGWVTVTLIAVGGVLFVAASAAGVFFAWRAYGRRVLLRLVARTEAVEAVGQALVDCVERLAHADHAVLEEFACDAESSERRALHEVAMRAWLLARELDSMPLPRALIPTAESLADAAMVVHQEASRIGDGVVGEAALDALARTDLVRVKAYASAARTRVNDECVSHGLDDLAVYGGGLYL